MRRCVETVESELDLVRIQDMTEGVDGGRGLKTNVVGGMPEAKFIQR